MGEEGAGEEQGPARRGGRGLAPICGALMAFEPLLCWHL